MFITTGPVRSYVEVAGPPDAPTVVFANSLGTDLRIWHDVVQLLGPGVRTVRYDMRGHGMTAPPPPPYAMAALAEDLNGILEALRIEPAIVCGVSVGGAVALQLASAHRDRVRGLVLCDTGYRIGTLEMWNQRIANVEANGMASISEAVMERWFTAAYRQREPEQVAGYRYLVERTTVAGYAGISAALRDADLEPAARALECPTRVLCGDQDVATPPDMNRALAAAIRGASFHLVAGSGHLPSLEQPAAVAEHIAAMVRDHGRG